MRVMWAVLAWPLIEIALFVVIGGRIGVWATLGWVLVTAVLGVLILRLEAARSAVSLREGLGRLRATGGAPGAGIFRAMAGMLLVLPGFLTDAAGLILLLPPVQAALVKLALSRVSVVQARHAGFGRASDEIVEGEWEDVPAPLRERLDDGRAERGGRKPSRWSED